MDDENFSNELLIERVITDLRWSPDSKKLAVASYGADTERYIKEPKIQVYDTSSNQIVSEYRLDSPSYGLAWHQNSLSLACVTHSGKFSLFHDEIRQEHQISPIALGKVSWSPTGDQLVTGGWENILYRISADGKILDAAILEIPKFPGMSDAILWVGWQPNGNIIATTGIDGILRLWRSENMRQLSPLQEQSSKSILGAWNPDGERIAGYEHSITIWDIKSKRAILNVGGRHTPVNGIVDWNADGTHLGGVCADETIRIWNAATGKVEDVISADFKITHLSWSKDNRLAYGGRADFYYDEDYNLVEPPFPLYFPLKQ